MVDFDYSVEAKNVLNHFYSVDKIVYVEGDDDVIYWEVIFDKLADFKVEMKPVGGKPELMKSAQAIYDNQAEYLIAMDSDYDSFNSSNDHQNILRTHGYSIENSLITSNSISKIIKNLARLTNKEDSINDCNEWFRELNEKVRPLVLMDITNELEGSGIKVIPDNSDRFMISKNSYTACSDKISQHIDQLPIEFSDSILSINDNAITQKGLSYCDILRGHFLLSAALRFVRLKVKEFGKSPSISGDMFYSNCISIFENIFNERHPHYSYYQQKLLPLNA